MTEELSLIEIKKEYHGTLTAYLVGFVLCLLLTGASFFLVITNVLSGVDLIYTIVALALLQAITQLLCFLHLGQEDKPRWHSFIFWFMVSVLLIIAVGSLWIMHDLNARMMAGM